MDTARAVFGRLMLTILVCVVGVFAVVPVAHAEDGWFDTEANAYAACQSNVNGTRIVQMIQACTSSGDTCGDTTHPTIGAIVADYIQQGPGWTGEVKTCWAFGQTSASNPCSSLTGYSGDFTYDPGHTEGTTVHQYVKDPFSSASVECDGTVAYSGPPTMDDYGHLHVHGTISWNSNPGSGSGAAGTSAYQDSSGSDMNPQPGFTSGSSPDICGAGSCYDPNTNQFCGTAGGTQFCVSGSTADSSQGGCSSVGGATICAGSPQPPLPPSPPGSQITDPAKQVQGSDTYQQQDPSSGGMTSTTVTVYGQQGTKSSSGATSSSLPANSSGPNAPASSSTAGGDSVSGGGSCTSPPACMGDAVQCAVVQQTYATRCNAEQVHKDLAGTTSAPQSGQHQFSEVNGGNTDLGAQVGNLDMGGFGYSAACPFTKVGFRLGAQDASIDMTIICGWQGWMSGLILVLASMKCADILGGK